MRRRLVARGAYHFFCPKRDGIAQADPFLSVLGDLEDGDLPPALDVEVCATGVCGSACDWGDVDCHTIVTHIHEWVDRVAEVTGRRPVIYTGWGSWEGPVCGSDELALIDLWVANWDVECPLLPDAWSRWAFWQTGIGRVDGVPTDVDLDVFNVDLDVLRDYTSTGASVPACGDGACAADESCESCVDDCGACDPGVEPRTCSLLDAAGGIIDDLNPCWSPIGPSRWDPESPEGYAGHLFWVAPTPGPAPQNWAFWNLALSEAGSYLVEVYLEGAFAAESVRSAVYQVGHAGRIERAALDQSAGAGWAPLGTFDFAAGWGQYVRLDDVPAYAAEGELVLFDAVRLTRVTGTGAADADADAGADGSAGPAPSVVVDESFGCSVAPGLGRGTSGIAWLLGVLPLAMLAHRRRPRR